MAWLGRYSGMLMLAVAGLGTILFGCSGGGESSSTPASVSLSDLITASSIVDVNGDGKNDILITTQGASDLVLINDGNGSSFTAKSLPPHYQGGNGQTVVFEPGDLNKDGKIDTLTVTPNLAYSSARIQLFLGHGDGTFEDASANITGGVWPLSAPYLAGGTPGTWPEWLRVVDVDGDGSLDFVATGIGAGVVGGYIYRNDGTGKFVPVSIALTDGVSNGVFKALGGNALVPFAQDFFEGDLNNDGKPDLFGPSGGPHAAFLNTSNPGSISFTIKYSPNTAPMFNGVMLDINGDGFLDVVGSPFNGTGNPIPVVAYLGNGAGVFSENNTVFSPTQPTQVWQRQYLTADFNGDGKQDVLIADSGYDFVPFPGARNWLLINQNGVLVDKTQTNLSVLPAYTHEAAIGDLNGDGHVDLILNNSFQTLMAAAKEPRFWLNNGAGVFTSYNPVIHQ